MELVQQLQLVPLVMPCILYLLALALVVLALLTLLLVLHHVQIVFLDVTHVLLVILVQAVLPVGTKIPLALAINVWQTLILPLLALPLLVLHALSPNILMLVRQAA